MSEKEELQDEVNGLRYCIEELEYECCSLKSELRKVSSYYETTYKQPLFCCHDALRRVYLDKEIEEIYEVLANLTTVSSANIIQALKGLDNNLKQ